MRFAVDEAMHGPDWLHATWWAYSNCSPGPLRDIRAIATENERTLFCSLGPEPLKVAGKWIAPSSSSGG